MKEERLEHHALIHRLKFEEVVARGGKAKGQRLKAKGEVSLLMSAATEEEARAAREKAEAELAELQSRITPLQTEINQLGTPVLGEQGAGRRPELRPLRQPLPPDEQEEVF